ncbi:MAG: hypothetical protein MUF53_00255 [Gemmatimonadaceae bacterium]|jgi:hypothetical protein|nr:hypothetical protein [Gemmatimonadaceae bacterium]
MSFRALACCVAMVVCSPTVHAQSSEPLPFRAGQWGAEFTVANQNVGTLLRFRAPDRALAFNVSGGGNWRLSGDATSPESRTIQLGLAVRRYRSLVRSVVGFTSIGGEVQYTGFNNAAPVGTLSGSFVGVGATAGAGAQWFVLPRLSIGANVNAALRLTQETSRTGVPFGSPTTRRSTALGLSFGTFGLTGAIYF